MTDPSPDRPRPAGALATLVWRALALFVLANVVAWLVVVVHRRYFAPPPGPLAYGIEKLSQVYPGRTPEEIERLLTETWSRRYVYLPFVQHREAPQSGEYVNIDPAGFRRVADQGPWPPDPAATNVFFFGGSTTFGYGVADAETIPSRAQEALAAACPGDVRVYNFGGGNYYIEQERVLFEQLLAAGHPIDVAVFVDGLNEFKKGPKFTTRLRYLMAESRPRLLLRALKALPLAELAKLFRPSDAEPPQQVEIPPADAENLRLAEWAVGRWRANRRLAAAVAREFEVVPLFVWQPSPAYQYDLEHHLFRENRWLFAHRGPAHAPGYRLMDALRNESPELSADDFLWLADLHLGRSEPLYVDTFHYTAAFSREIAERIAAALAPRLGCEPAG